VTRVIGRAYDVRAVEARWQAEWQRAGCHRAPQLPAGEKCFVHDATPFPNGPQLLVRRAIAEQKRQLARLGISHDTDRLADTSDPAVYRWTQWLFLEMLRAGIIERREAAVTWCPRCETTLARIQVEDGGCWRCETPVA
jgi:leucyl-tRNA synthetase